MNQHIAGIYERKNATLQDHMRRCGDLPLIRNVQLTVVAGGEFRGSRSVRILTALDVVKEEAACMSHMNQNI